jgi:hypothetical protein
MTYYMNFDSYLIRERNQQMLMEVNELRLEKQLQANRGARNARGFWPEGLAAVVGCFRHPPAAGASRR